MPETRVDTDKTSKDRIQKLLFEFVLDNTRAVRTPHGEVTNSPKTTVGGHAPDAPPRFLPRPVPDYDIRDCVGEEWEVGYGDAVGPCEFEAARKPPDYDGPTTDPGEVPEFVGSKFYKAARDTSISGVFCPIWAISVTNSKAELLILSQFAYWFSESIRGKLRAKVKSFERWWVYKTYGSLAKETGLRKGQVRGAIRSLVGKGILVKYSDEDSGKPPYYRIDPRATSLGLFSTGSGRGHRNGSPGTPSNE